MGEKEAHTSKILEYVKLCSFPEKRVGKEKERTNLTCPSSDKYFYLSIRLVTNSVICILCVCVYMSTYAHTYISLYIYIHIHTCIYVYVKKPPVNTVASDSCVLLLQFRNFTCLLVSCPRSAYR